MNRIPAAALSAPACWVLALLVVQPVRLTAQTVDVYENPNRFETVPAMKVGDPAPPLVIEEWLRGEPLGDFAAGTVYVVEFFASWCGPCRKSLPELDLLLRERSAEGLSALGVAAAETDDGTALTAMVDRFEDAISFSVGRTTDSATFRRWMQAARNSGLPWVFVIDRQGRIHWWGQPNDPEFRPAVERALAESFDTVRERRRLEERRRGRRVLWDRQESLWAAYEAEDWEVAEGHARELVASADQAFYYEAAVLFELLYSRLARPEEALRYGREVIGGMLRTQPEGLHRLAEVIVDSPARSPAALELAADALQRARRLTRDLDAEVLTTTARLELARGQREAATGLLRRALPYASEEQRTVIGELLERSGGGPNAGG